MRAHILSGQVIVNTIEVPNLTVIPNLVDASIGGNIGDSIINGVVVPKPPPTPVAPDATPIITSSFNAGLKRKAAKLQDDGKSFEAVQLLLQAQGIQS